MKRQAGILMPVASLPSNFGIGDIGPTAFKFIDFLKKSRQSIWEVLPLNIPNNNGSPYASCSAIAGNWLVISLELLYQQGLLNKNQLPKKINPGQINYLQVRKMKQILLRQAFANFQRNKKDTGQFEKFKRQEKKWLNEYALYQALKNKFNHLPWWQWPKNIAAGKKSTLKKLWPTLTKETKYHQFVQWVFYQQWSNLKKYTNKNKIKIFGDLPFFIAHDSADVWANQKLFLLNRNSQPEFISGAPPDYFSKKGQLWDDPQYNWKVMQKNNFKWWQQRFSKASQLYDLVRLDHFRGYQALWYIPAKTRNPKTGHWQLTPGRQLLQIIKNKLGRLPVIAEDLGTITRSVIKLRNDFNIPGMRVMLFGFSGQTDNFHLPKNWPVNCVAYTSTHDTDTAKGWFVKSGQIKERLFAKKYLKTTAGNFSQKLIYLGAKSKARIFIVPIQDYLNLGSEARTNRPGTIKGNWQWQAKKGRLNKVLAKKIKKIASQTKRG